MTQKIIIGILICLASYSAIADEDDPAAELRKGQPPSVANLIDRIVGCNHWLGEEPYDADRAKEIRAAVNELRCDKLEKDTSVILKKYESNPKVKKAIEAAKDIVQ